MKRALRRLQRLEKLKGGKRTEFWIYLADDRVQMGSEVKARAEFRTSVMYLSLKRNWVFNAE